MALLLSYGASPLLVVPGIVLLAQRRFRHLGVVVAAAAAALLVVRAGTGFSWWDGLHATRDAYWDGIATRRPAGYLVPLGNPTALLVAVGPAAVVGLVVVIRRWTQDVAPLLLPMAALLAVAAADLSMPSKGEVERIWLPFTIWLAAAAAGDRRRWLVVQAVVGVGVQLLVATPW